MEDRKVSIDDVYRLMRIFQANHWFTKAGSTQVHNHFIEMLENFSDLQKDLLFELTERYLWITFPEYLQEVLTTLETVEEKKLEKCTRIIAFPIVKPNDIGKVKSSNSLLYLFKSSTSFGVERYKGITFKIIDSYKKFEKEKFAEGDLLFLVDDFVGSGDTLKTTLGEVQKNLTLNDDQINILALVAQREISENLAAVGISLYCLHIRNKGVSDHYPALIAEYKRNLMLEIEKLIPNLSSYSFGYNQTEALVTMNRTPNNTFPIFWKDHRKGGKIFKAPFPR